MKHVAITALFLLTTSACSTGLIATGSVLTAVGGGVLLSSASDFDREGDSFEDELGDVSGMYVGSVTLVAGLVFLASGVIWAASEKRPEPAPEPAPSALSFTE